MVSVAESILARLKSESKNTSVSIQQLLNLFCQEEFIRRLSRSDYKENLILKGELLLYYINEFTNKPTINADYLLKNYPNNIEAIERLVTEVISIDDENEFIDIQIRNLEPVSKFKECHDVRVNLIGMIGTSKTSFSLNFCAGDIIIPSPVERTLPVLLADFEEPKILTYSLESTVAEKIDAIISLKE